MTYTYEDVIPTLIPNTTMQKRLLDGVHRSYVIAPIDGYVLHTKSADYEETDPETLMPTGRVIFMYASGRASCGANYDFTPLQVTDENGVTFTAYGSRAFFARPVSEVPVDLKEENI